MEGVGVAGGWWTAGAGWEFRRGREGCSEEFEWVGYWFEEELESAVEFEVLVSGYFCSYGFLLWVIGTDLGKKARMKMARKMTVFLGLVSKGIELDLSPRVLEV